MLMELTNQTEEMLEASFSCDHPLVHSFRYFVVVWGSLVCATGTVGNLMTILAFAFDPHLRTRFNTLIVNLAVADLLSCTVVQPITVDSYLHLRWRYGTTWCWLYSLLIYVFNGVSITTMCLIAVSRYLLVARRSLFHLVFSNCGLVLLLTFPWSFALITFSPHWNVYAFVPKICSCSFHLNTGRPYITIMLLCYIFLCLMCMSVFYLLIYRKVWISTKALRRYRLSHCSSRKKPAATLVEIGADCSSTTGSCTVVWRGQTDLGRSKLDWTDWDHTKQDRTEQDRTNLYKTDLETKQDQINLGQATLDNHSEKQVTPVATVVSSASPSSTDPPCKAPCPTASSHSATPEDNSYIKRVTCMCFVVCLCFVFCYLPFLLISLLDKNHNASPWLHLLCAKLTWLNCCINPMLYAVMNRQFRQAFRVLLTRATTLFTILWARF